ncbi:MAG: hypothetical protein A3D96_07640 [Chlamydiae bacterium RIFCSPHIGHO2_12_FULL_44_59]|nr:MAG: hypothetical protein A2796_06950 [Chlamydiae bacterium RIFCSPHIGHO2_01_FULL_44_39]OGN59558.1 MAG: hypothetical protein A3D96_07640 [Chlamydiae bacterium RIFCSPHIGHO2_12_FULL_44_59]OGN67304.1 MAG: hypothetical protein A2978_03470 [Chlamydiae bacterium RIFCSPLOWO2_01_FULL_44_52]OGN68724.1 MAG: hypothetical protein A3I67_03200 [Chlamydiae bacterium RIFCSPLOWO2_02_FULL_45_22]OGN69246.1 MAG: hypothetical protein A3F79_04985 [Chlamydiae bacterium RIFCSPLOWO2_12_FULL_45_20]
MLKFFQKAFGLYSGDWAQALRFTRLAALWAFGSSCLDTLSDGLFLEQVGAGSLPNVYLSIACGTIFVSTLVLYSLRHTSPYRILTTAMVLGGSICISAAIFLETSPPVWFWYAIKIAARMFFAVMIACSWTFTDQYHDLQDAKRVYSIYSAAYFFGTIIAGTAINLFLASIGVRGLLLLAAGSISLALIEARNIAHKTKAVHDDTIEGIFSGSRDTFTSLIKLITRSRFAIVLLLLSLFLQLMVTVTEFNYMETFGNYFASTSGELSEGSIAIFLGKCRAIISACNIIIGIFFYGRFVRKMGLNNIILVTPLFFFGVYSGWILQNAMWLAVLGLIAVDGVLFTIEDNCFNLLSNAVPSKLKSKVRIINDFFFEPIGMLLSALLLFALSDGSRWLGMVLTVITLTLALIIKSIYSKAIMQNLKENALHFEKKVQSWLYSMTRREQRESKKDILAALRSPSEETQLLAIESLLDLSLTPPQILNAARRFSTAAKIQFLRLIDQTPFGNDSRILEMIDTWTDESESKELGRRAYLYLAKRGLLNPEKVEDDLGHPDLFLRGAAILTMKKSLAQQSFDTAALNRTIASKKLDLMLKSSHIDEISMGLDILAEEPSLETAEKALPFLSHEALVVKRAAARCLARLSDKRLSRHAFRLLEVLEEAKDNTLRLSLLETLGNISDSTTTKEILLASVYLRPNERRKAEKILVKMGLKIVPLLISFTKDIGLPERARVLAGKILGQLALPQLQANLPDILDIEIERAYFYFYFGHTIQKKYPLYDLNMLESALLTGYQSVIDFIIHLLGAAGSSEDPELIVRGLHSRNEKTHSHAVESLEKTCDVRIFKLIAPLLDDLPLEDKMAACLKWQGDYPELSLSELLSKLEQSPSLFDRVVAVRLKAQLKMPNWREELREQMKHSDENFHQFAYELLEL